MEVVGAFSFLAMLAMAAVVRPAVARNNWNSDKRRGWR